MCGDVRFAHAAISSVSGFMADTTVCRRGSGQHHRCEPSRVPGAAALPRVLVLVPVRGMVRERALVRAVAATAWKIRPVRRIRYPRMAWRISREHSVSIGGAGRGRCSPRRTVCSYRRFSGGLVHTISGTASASARFVAPADPAGLLPLPYTVVPVRARRPGRSLMHSAGERSWKLCATWRVAGRECLVSHCGHGAGVSGRCCCVNCHTTMNRATSSNPGTLDSR